METHSILVFGERLGDLLAATDKIEAIRRGEPPDPYDNAQTAPLFRAVARAAAEILLVLADSAHPLGLVGLDEHLIGIAYGEVVNEIDAVLLDPLCLQVHPALAQVPSRRQLIDNDLRAV